MAEQTVHRQGTGRPASTASASRPTRRRAPRAEQARTMKEMAKAAELVRARDPQRREGQPAALQGHREGRRSARRHPPHHPAQRRRRQPHPRRHRRFDRAGARAHRAHERAAKRSTSAAKRSVADEPMNTAPTLGVVTTDRHLAIRGWNEWVAAATGVAGSRRRSAARCWTSSRRSVPSSIAICFPRCSPPARHACSRRPFTIT